MPALFSALAAIYSTAAQCAAALGMTRQAYSQATKRRHFSESKAMLAGTLCGIDPARALLLNATKTDTPAPILDATTHPTNHPPERAPTPAPRPNPDSLYYVKSENTDQRHGNDSATECRDEIKKNVVHSIVSKEKSDAVDLIRWVLAVARIAADSPRFCYYVSRWRVPEKIAAAKASGNFEPAVRNCPPIDPSWVRHVPAALAAYQEFITPTKDRPQKQPALKYQPPRFVKVSKIAA